MPQSLRAFDRRARLMPWVPTAATRRLLRVVWPFLAAMALLLLLAAASFALLSAGRAYVEGESLWSKGQKNAVQALAHYSESCEPRHFEQYRADMALPLGDRQARLELLKPTPRLDVATAGFLQGGNDPSEVAGMIFLFRHFGQVPVFQEAITIWTEADVLLMQLAAAAEALDQAVRQDCAHRAARRPALEEVYRLNDRLTPLQREFSEVLGRANRFINRALLALMAALGLLLAGLGILLSRRVVRQAMAAERDLLAELRQRRAALATLREMLPTLGALPAAARPLPPHEADDIAAVTRAVARLSAHQVETHARLQAILALSPDAFVSFDAAGEVRHVSPAFVAITGVPPDEVLGRTAAHFSARMSRQCGAGQQFPSLAQLRAAGPGCTLDVELALPEPRSLAAELNEGGQDAPHEAIRSVLCLRDVTRQRALDRLKGEFISLAAHELRTPMASIFGFVELLLSRPSTAERRAEVLGVIHRQSLLMMGIIDDLLDLDRLQSGGVAELQLDAVDLGALLARACADFAPPAGREPPVVEALPGSAIAAADAGKVRRVLHNLLTNAYKYSPPGTPVRLGLVEAEGKAGLGLFVQDQGIGMTPEQLARIGERFYRADDSGKVPGTGLGVSIVKEILLLHGGHLDIASREGQGTRATAWFRRAEAVQERRRA